VKHKKTDPFVGGGGTIMYAKKADIEVGRKEGPGMGKVSYQISNGIFKGKQTTER